MKITKSQLREIIKEELDIALKEDGHEEVPSAIRTMKTVIEDAAQMLQALETMDGSLPTWWTNKLAVAAAYINSDRDYLVFTMQQASNTEASADENEDQQITINFNAEEDDMMPPSAKMVERKNASEEG